MVRMINRSAGLLLSVALLYCSSVVHAELIVNEIMVNEPGGATNYEWIELFVDSTGSIFLDDYELLVDNEQVTVPEGLELEAQSYLIVCKKLHFNS